ncbi:hypothetical protein VTN77DRAFT_6284 [Rasamsonia byssochlamydoides]|uniref:uncharacterized protein n=1 Tax=Rasamsonia byssochlamydoides TaxID=89139 RepID=UPI00374242F8
MPTFHFSREGIAIKASSSDSAENTEDLEGLMSEEKEGSINESVQNSVRKRIPSMFWAGLFMVLVSFTVIVVTVVHPVRDDDFCFKRSTYYSPLTKDIDTTPRFVITNGTLDFPSIYRGPPSPEIDAAWNHISYDMGVFALTEEEALKAGLHEGDVRIPAGYQGGGEYMASLELTHQLHCVNFLRKAAWLNYPYYHDKGFEFTDPEDELEKHLYHCIEMLRQALMCNADPGVIGYRYVRGRESRPYPDFNTPHKCRDFQGMLEWAYEHMVHGHPEELPFVPGKDEIVWDHAP